MARTNSIRAKPIESSSSPALDIQVVSLDWKWLFIYPEHRIASVNELVVPAGVPLHFSLTSSSVMNTFFVPQLGSMIYTMNGMATQLYLQAEQRGRRTTAMSAHYSGEGFSDMHFDVKCIPYPPPISPVGSTGRARAATGRSTSLRYDELARQSINVPVEHLLRRREESFRGRRRAEAVSPGPGPGTEREGAATKPEIKS